MVLEHDIDLREVMQYPYMLRYQSEQKVLEMCTTTVTDNENWIITVVANSCAQITDGPFRVTAYEEDKLSFVIASSCVTVNVVRGSPYVNMRVVDSPECSNTLPIGWSALPEAMLSSLQGWNVQWKSASEAAIRTYRFAHSTFAASDEIFGCVAVRPFTEVRMQSRERAVMIFDWDGRTWDNESCDSARVVALPHHKEALELGASAIVYEQAIA